MFAKNKTNFSSFASFNASSCNSTSGSCTLAQNCPGTSVHLAYISVSSVIGVIGNTLVLYADYKEWKKRKTPDKVLIFNLSMTNIIALLICLPLHAVAVGTFKDLLNCVGSIFQFRLSHDALHLCSFVTLGTLLVIGIDRYQALAKFAHQRTLDIKKSFYAIGFVWLCALASAASLLLSRPRHCLKMYSVHSPHKKTDTAHALRTVVVATWITVCCAVTSASLVKAARRIRQHREEINGMLGQAQAAVQISFTKGTIALALCYLIFWTPYGISSAVLPSGRHHKTIMCLKLWTSSTFYLSFSLLPFVYFIVDSRLRRVLLSSLRVAAAPLPVTVTNSSNTESSKT